VLVSRRKPPRVSSHVLTGVQTLRGCSAVLGPARDAVVSGNPPEAVSSSHCIYRVYLATGVPGWRGSDLEGTAPNSCWSCRCWKVKASPHWLATAETKLGFEFRFDHPQICTTMTVVFCVVCCSCWLKLCRWCWCGTAVLQRPKAASCSMASYWCCAQLYCWQVICKEPRISRNDIPTEEEGEYDKTPPCFSNE